MGSVTFGLRSTTGTGSGGHGRPWEAIGSVTFELGTTIGTGSGAHRRPREAMGRHGFGNLAGNYHWDRLGRPWEATGGHGRPQETVFPRLTWRLLSTLVIL